MRKKTKRILVGAAFGIGISSLLLLVSFYFFFYRPYQQKLTDYQKIIASYRNPIVVKAYRLKNDKKAMSELTNEDLEILELPQNIASQALAPINQAVYGQRLNADVRAGTILHSSMLYQGQQLASDLRIFELNGLRGQKQIAVADVVDVRINFPSGLDYVVLSKKRLIDFWPIANQETISCVFHLDEKEILRLSSAVVDAYLHKGSYLYLTKYISSNNQQAAAVTYPVNTSVQKLIAIDPNIVDKAMDNLKAEDNNVATTESISSSTELETESSGQATANEQAYNLESVETATVDREREVKTQAEEEDIDLEQWFTEVE